IWRVGLGSLEKHGGGVVEWFLWVRGVVGVAVWCQIGTLVARSISFLLLSLFTLLRRVKELVWLNASWVSLGGGAAVLLPLVLLVSGGVSLRRSALSRKRLCVVFVPSREDQRRVLRRWGVCEDISCWSCQLRRSFSVAMRAEIAGYDGVWRHKDASSPNKARPFHSGVLGHESSGLFLKAAD
ncbi:hypothetical protein IGI04_032697, partial [Brassica rapa subsp. trilocularis]